MDTDPLQFVLEKLQQMVDHGLIRRVVKNDKFNSFSPLTDRRVAKNRHFAIREDEFYFFDVPRISPYLVHVTTLRAEDLPNQHVISTTSPFVRFYVDGKLSAETHVVIHNGATPEWNESCVLGAESLSSVVEVVVCDHNLGLMAHGDEVIARQKLCLADYSRSDSARRVDLNVEDPSLRSYIGDCQPAIFLRVTVQPNDLGTRPTSRPEDPKVHECLIEARVLEASGTRWDLPETEGAMVWTGRLLLNSDKGSTAVAKQKKKANEQSYY